MIPTMALKAKKQREFVYRCSACGHQEPKWLGRCPECGEWNTLIETAAATLNPGSGTASRGLPPQSLPLSSIDPQEGSRIGSGILELDRVLGGGIMKRSAILIGGEPGIGKSTLLLQIAAAAETRGRVLYISGEESAGQIRMRSDRLDLSAYASRIEIGCSGRLEDISALLDSVKPVIVLVDSAQTLYSTEAGLSPGTVNQMKYCTWELISWVKDHDAALFLTAHVTKEGLIAGPKTLEHLVDTVLYFEGAEASDGESRFLRASKNRFGSVDEIGIFTMGERGLSPVEDASRLFLVRREGELPAGVATAAVLEGSRSLLVEIQALTVPAKSGMSRVYSDRIDSGRVSRVSAALEKHLGIRLSDQDIYVNVAGGIRIAEVGVELALGCAIYSARTGFALPSGLAIAGELSLTGEIRPLRRMAGRLRAARSLGFPQFLGPPGPEGASTAQESPENGVFLPAADIKTAIRALFKPA
ncbi:MAG: DNA repair protein RadA [Treponema sp.]|jgi:DNA repair protein RadA/Sms|nr:DNA repair protein RadA [Treponema sp.]